MKKEKNKRSNISGNFGNNFQVDSCIFMYLKNVKECKYVGFEGEEDFDIILKNDKYLYFQAKSAMKDNTIDKTQFSAIKNAILSFDDVKEKDGSFNVVFNFHKPFINSKQFGEIPYEIFKYDSLSECDKKEISNFLEKNNANVKCDNVDFHFLRYEPKGSESYIYSKICDFLSENKMMISSKEIGDKWFSLLQRNGKEDEYIESGVLAGAVFVSLCERYDFNDIINKATNDLDAFDKDKIFRIYQSFLDNSMISFIEYSKIRSKYQEFLYKNNMDLDLKSIFDFANSFATLENVPNYFDDLVNNITDEKKDIYKITLYKIHVIVQIHNDKEINKVKGAFGYEN